MSTSPLDPQEIRAAAEAHNELGPEYNDAVIESFLERVDREITARVDARLGPVSREQPVQPAQSNSRRTLLTGVAIGIFVAGVPSAMVAASGRLATAATSMMSQKAAMTNGATARAGTRSARVSAARLCTRASSAQAKRPRSR